MTAARPRCALSRTHVRPWERRSRGSTIRARARPLLPPLAGCGSPASWTGHRGRSPTPQCSSPRLLFRSMEGGATPTKKLATGEPGSCSRRTTHECTSICTGTAPEGEDAHNHMAQTGNRQGSPHHHPRVHLDLHRHGTRGQGRTQPHGSVRQSPTLAAPPPTSSPRSAQARHQRARTHTTTWLSQAIAKARRTTTHECTWTCTRTAPEGEDAHNHMAQTGNRQGSPHHHPRVHLDLHRHGTRGQGRPQPHTHGQADSRTCHAHHTTLALLIALSPSPTGREQGEGKSQCVGPPVGACCGSPAACTRKPGASQVTPWCTRAGPAPCPARTSPLHCPHAAAPSPHLGVLAQAQHRALPVCLLAVERAQLRRNAVGGQRDELARLGRVPPAAPRGKRVRKQRAVC